MEREGYGKPVVTTYLFDEKHLTEGNILFKRFEAYTAEWAKFIVANRQNRANTPIHDFDIVYGQSPMTASVCRCNAMCSDILM